MKRWLFLFLALMCTARADAAPTIRGLFVGIDHYRFSDAHVQGAGFGDLRGAVADTRQIKAALRAAYGLDLDEPGSGTCESSNAVSITLTDTCATWKKIVEALNRQIAASRPGDTLIFYFAGHGSRLADDQQFVEASGYFSTILPTDARDPGAAAANDLLDDDINTFIQIANARGVIVVTIFDSCFSGAGTRGTLVGDAKPDERENRGVKVLHLKPVRRELTRLEAVGPGGGYRVHFAASDADEESREVMRDGQVNGVFTKALSQVLVEMPRATFGDIATAARLKVLQAGQNRQHPRAEGQLQASMGGGARDVALFDAALEGDHVRIAAGSLLGLTRGSRFALFDGDTAALADGASPLTLGTVDGLDAWSANLALDTPLSGSIARLRARETSHAFALQSLSVGLPDAGMPTSAQLEAALKAVPFVRIDAAAPFRLVAGDGSTGRTVSLAAMDRTLLANLGQDTDPGFAQRLRAALLTLYNAQRILALPAKTASEAQISFCIAHDLTYDIRSCPGSTGTSSVGSGRRLQVNRDALLTVSNMSPVPRYLYVLVIDDRFGITMVVPTHGGEDPKITEGGTQRPVLRFDSPGLYRFVTIASTEPIAVKTLQQSALRRDYTAQCDPQIEGASECLIARQGNRGGAAPQIGEWTITVEDATAGREGEKAP